LDAKLPWGHHQKHSIAAHTEPAARHLLQYVCENHTLGVSTSPVADLCTKHAGSRLTASISTAFQLTAPQTCSSSLLTCQHSNRCCLHWTDSCYQRPDKHAKVQSRASRLKNFRQLSTKKNAKKGTSGFSSFFPVGYRGIVHPPSDGEGTERTWFEPKQRPRNAFLSDQSMASNPREGQAKHTSAKTTSPDGKDGHVMSHV